VLNARWRPWLLLVALLALHVAANLVWISRDTTLRSFDMGPHIEYISNTTAVVAHEGAAGVWRVARGGEGPQIWPSAGYLPWIALSSVFGHSVAHLRAYTSLFLGLLLVAVFLCGRRLRSADTGLLAAALVSLYPMVFAESRQVGVDLPGTAMTAAGFYLLLATEGWSRPWRCLALGAVCGAGVLVSPRIVFFLGAPVAAALALALARPARCPRARVAIHAALAAVAAAAVTSPWWFGRVGQILGILREHSQAAMYRPPEGSISFYAHMLPWGFSPYLLLVALLAAGLLLRYRGRLSPALRRWLPLLLWPLGGAAALLFMDVHHLRYTMMLAPAVALITAAGLRLIPHRRSRLVITALALSVGAAVWLVDSFGPQPVNLGWPGRSNLALGDPGERLELASGPPAENVIVAAAQRIGATLQKRHPEGGLGVLVLEQGDRDTFYVSWRVRPVLAATLPGIALVNRLEDWRAPDVSNWTGSSVPRLVARPEHCYTLLLAAETAASEADLVRITITRVPPGAAADLPPAEAVRPITFTLRSLPRCR